jgi:hypothetical protein
MRRKLIGLLGVGAFVGLLSAGTGLLLGSHLNVRSDAASFGKVVSDRHLYPNSAVAAADAYKNEGRPRG